jgi:endo-1,4-beta-xylanase
MPGQARYEVLLAMRKPLAFVGAGLLVALVAGGFAACGSSRNGRNGGASGTDAAASAGATVFGGAPAAGGAVGSGGAGGGPPTGGASGLGAVAGAGGLPGLDAPAGTGGLPGPGGTQGTGGLPDSGGALGTGGMVGKGGATGSGGLPTTGGATVVGGTTGFGGSTGGATGSGGTTSVCASTPLPSGGTSYCNTNTTGPYGSYQWTLWESGSGGCLITYGNGDAAFSATWDSSSGDFLARVGLKWDATKTYDQLGTITAQFAETRSGTGGGYSYIGAHGWSLTPCVEWYVVEDSFTPMPFNPGSVSSVGTATIDGGTYTLYASVMTGTGTAQCSGVSPWTGIYSVRQTARQCGQISLTEHFNAWKSAGLTLGKMEEAALVVETLGGSGRVDFTTASLTVQ